MNNVTNQNFSINSAPQHCQLRDCMASAVIPKTRGFVTSWLLIRLTWSLPTWSCYQVHSTQSHYHLEMKVYPLVHISN